MTKDLLLRGSIGRAYRFPTVGELFQTFTGPAGTTLGNPNLQPEISTAYELTGEYTMQNLFGGAIGYARPRVTLFLDDRWNTITVQQNPMTRTTDVTNLDKTRFRGVEGAIDVKDFIEEGLDLTANVTFTDAKTLSNWRVPNTQGMQVINIPRIRMRGLATYTPPWDRGLSLSAGVRFQTAAFGTIDNSDFNKDAPGAFASGFLFFDARVNYKVAPDWTLSAGVDNIGSFNAFSFHAYPQRTYFLSLRYDLGAPGPSGAAQQYQTAQRQMQ